MNIAQSSKNSEAIGILEQIDGSKTQANDLLQDIDAFREKEEKDKGKKKNKKWRQKINKIAKAEGITS